MDRSTSLPTWSELFGSPDTKEADAGRSVTSPAAYLADLLQLLEDRFAGSDFTERRPDVTERLPLNGEQSFTLVRQLDLVNQVLADRVSALTNGPADEVLASATHPFMLPFDAQHVRVTRLLALLRTPYRDLHSAFVQRPDIDVLARERLGLSPAQAAIVASDRSGDPAALVAAYGLSSEETLASLRSLERLRRATQLDGPSLRELLFLTLSQGRDGLESENGRSERDLAGQLFIHHELGGFVTLDASELQLVWVGEGEGIPDAWFDRVHRIVCLSRWTGIGVGSLDLILRQLCGHELDLQALQRIALLVDLKERAGVELEVSCALISELDGSAALGSGDDPKQAASLFDRVFNGERARLAKRHLPSGSELVPAAYQTFTPLIASGDLLVDEGSNKDLRTRIETALGIAPRELVAIITRFRERASARGRTSRLTTIDSRGLSILHRIVRLAELADLSATELLRLVDVLEKDSSLKVLNAFDLFAPQELASADLYELIEQGSIEARSWLVQNVVAVAAWAGAAGLTPEDLEAAAIVPSPELPAQQAELLATARSLHEALLGTALGAESFVSEEISARTARIALETFCEPERGLVSPVDARLVTWNEAAARQAAHDTVAALDVITIEDIATLGLGEELASHLQAVLVRRGVLDEYGILREDALPARAADLVLEPHSAERFDLIFSFLHASYADALAQAESSEEESSEEESSADYSLEAPEDSDDASEYSEADDESEYGEEDADEDEPASDSESEYGEEAEEDGVDEAEAEYSEEEPEESDDASEYGEQDADEDEEEIEDGEQDAEDGEQDGEDSDVAAAGLEASAALGDVELQLHPSDLLALGFELAEAGELIERLTFLGVLDDSGMVRDPSLFSELENRDAMPTHVGLDLLRDELHALLSAGLGQWRASELRLPDGIWDALPLTPAQREALEQNLVFNGHIDAARRIVDRKALGALTADSFDLTLPFYRHRRAILSALQTVVSSAREAALYVGPEELRGVADRFVAMRAHHGLSLDVLDDRGRLEPDVLAQIDSEQPPFDLGVDLPAATQQRIWDLLRSAAAEASLFRLTAAALASVDLVDEHATEVVVALCAGESMRADCTLSPEQVARFSVVLNGQDFQLPGYADYARDVFFLLHDVAVAVDSAVAILAASLAKVALAQEAAVVEALAARVELPANATMAILRPLLRDEPHLVAALLVPVLRSAGDQDVVVQAPRDRAFCTTLGRLRAFASFARKLQMTPRQIEVAFQDQQLADKFAEALELPAGVDAIDALWTAPNQKTYLFRGNQYWAFDGATSLPLELARPLSTLCPEFQTLTAVDAVYTLATGEHWLLAQGRAFRRAQGSERWAEVPRTWGRVRNRFDDPESVSCALHDREGRLHLFSGDQYVRYSSVGQPFVDEGYPKSIAGRWEQELGFGALPSGWSDGIDAAAGRGDEITWLFRGGRYATSAAPGIDRAINESWGHVRNNLASAARVDAVVDLDGRCGVVVGDQLAVFSNGLENVGLSADDGFPRTLSAFFGGLPEAFAHGFDAGLSDEDGSLHLFRDQLCATRTEGWSTTPTRERWGRVRNELQESGRVDAALAGLDGKIYLFSGSQYVRYSGADLTRVDEGYPRAISRDWGGLSRVDAAFVLDGQTYLFGSDYYNRFYVRYSTRDYTKVDLGYPKPTDDNWWNLPDALVQQGFALPDGVFVAPDGRIHLFSGSQAITFDHNHRWWSEPVPLATAWNSLPLATVSAAFTGKDGRSYLFATDGEPQFVRYTDPTFQRVDDRFPKPVNEHWGKVVNNLERTGKVDAAVSLLSTVSETALDGTVTIKKVRYRYLFSGDQFLRYSSDQQTHADEGYPLRIQGNLRREPHFVNLDAPAERGIDGLWADRGNVFVFISDRIYAASTAPVRELDGFPVEGARAADLEEGRLTVRTAEGWLQISSPEAHRSLVKPALPVALRGVPASFRTASTAVLRGLDRNVYLFADGQCYDRSLERQYPIGTSWGQVRNPIVEQNRVDAVLQGRDGELHLFRDDVFVSYTPALDAPGVLPEFADAAPAPIAASWGGLEDVRYAFVQRGVTYLLESPGEDGTFRYVRYFGSDYSRPNEPAPLAGDFSFWRIPEDYVRRGFDRVDAVLGEGDDLYLIRDGQFIHYEAATNAWTFPRPLALRWPGLAQRHPDFETVQACTLALDGRTYFFGDGAWLAHDGERPSELSAIASRWAGLRSRIVRSQRVDASLVYGDQTFLFSGDEYVRYTGAEYQYVDAGYPRAIAGSLRQELPFLHLPADVEAAFERLKPDDVWAQTVFTDGRVVCIQLAGRGYALSPQLSQSYPLARIARVRNELQRRERVDAALSLDNGVLLLLSGDQYVRYGGLDLDVVDDGYPRAIAEGLLNELAQQGAAALPPDFQYDIDATLLDKDGTLVLFKGKQFIRFDPKAADRELVPAAIKGTWGRVSNPFLPTPADPRPTIDAAFVAPDKALYLFKGGQYLRYADPVAELVDEGYPRSIRDSWGDLDPELEAGVEGAFVFGQRTYLCLRDRYIRYSGASYSLMDPSYPQRFGSRWRASNDFLLRDLRTIERYVALDRAHPSEDASLTDFLLSAPREKVDPYALLAELFDWQVGDLKWLKRRDAFLDRPARDALGEVRFDIEQLLRIHATMELCRRLGSYPQELYERVWSNLRGGYSQPAVAADTLERLLRSLHPGESSQLIARQLGDALSVARRDALVAWLVAHSPEGLSDARALSDLLLTDVEIDASVEGSPVTEAIGAVQVYFHRYLTNLEPKAAAGNDVARRAIFKSQWKWLKNYRVWEANRKVFLYPESYIRPELRDTRTDAFNELQDNLHQGEITEASVTQAYKKYLDEYTEVSRLIIAGGYVQPDARNAGDSELTLFGATRTEPRRHYYRTAIFKAGASSNAVWRAWRPLGIEIGAAQVYPVRAFGRLFVFWTEVEQKSADSNRSLTLKTVTKGDTQEVKGEERVQYSLKVLYSFYDLNEQWTTPQTLAHGGAESFRILSPRLRVTCVTEANGESAIELNFHYDVENPFAAIHAIWLAMGIPQHFLLPFGFAPWRGVSGARRLRADLTVSQATPTPMWDGRADKLTSLFAPGELGFNLDLDQVVVLGSGGSHSEAPWYSFDLKGGSFLARPVGGASQAASGSDGELRALAGNSDGLPSWPRIDACIETRDGKRLLFNNAAMVYREKDGTTDHATGERWGLRRTRVHEEQRVDAAWKRNGVLFLSRGDRYLKYASNLDWADEPGDLGTAEDRQRDQLPAWSTLDAAFTSTENATWFFSGGRCVALSGVNVFGRESAIGELWGHERNEFSAPAGDGPAVVAAFTQGERSYLIGPTSFTWYSDPDMALCERPRPQSLRAVLVELGCRNSNDVREDLRISEAVEESGGDLLFRVAGESTESYRLKQGKVSKVAPPAEEKRKSIPPRPFAGFGFAGRHFVLAPGKTGAAWMLADNVKERGESGQDIRAALRGLDGSVYLFGVDSFLRVAADEASVASALDNWSARAQPIAQRWGRVRNGVTSGQLSAAFVRGNATFLVSDDSYVRYSGSDHSFVDAGYPRALAGNPDGLPDAAIDAAIEDTDGRVCYFLGQEHAFGDALAQRQQNRSRWGRLRSNLLLRGPDAAYRVDRTHYLFSGSELASYTAGADNKLPEYMDGAPIAIGFGAFAAVGGAFAHRGFVYLVGRERFVCSAQAAPEQALAGYPRVGQARALIADLRSRFGLPDGDDGLADGQEVRALTLQGGALLLDTDDRVPGQHVLRFDLGTGELSRVWGPGGVDWASLRLDGSTYVDLPSARYSFRGDLVSKTPTGVAARWEETAPTRSIGSVWGGAPFDAAVTFNERVYFFDDAHYVSLDVADAVDHTGGSALVNTLRNALLRATPIRGSFATFPRQLLDGFDSALWAEESLYLFKGAQFVKVNAVPQENVALKYELVRLTTSTAAGLNQALFAGGLARLLSLRTQEADETPGFSTDTSGPTTIRVNPEQVNVATLPRDGQLDFASANGMYLWEIFFHAPFLIAETLSTAQRFEEARGWYEHIFDPTEPTDAWKFLPFLTVDVERIVARVQDRIDRIGRTGLDVTVLNDALALPSTQLLAMDAAFQGERRLSRDERDILSGLKSPPEGLSAYLDGLRVRSEPELRELGGDLHELVDMIAALHDRWEGLEASRDAQIDTYLDDPFDPHAIAAQRPIAYRKAIVMRYLDNLLEWGDMLFSRYTRESIDEARMLYLHAWNLLGRRPESLGRKLLPADSAYQGLRDARSGEYDMLLQLESATEGAAKLSFAGTAPNDSLAQPYFFLPPNAELERYWVRVADRLYKIRHSLNLLGLKQPLALFEPALDPMALVRAVAGGGGLSEAIDGAAAVEVPHYRFTFLAGRAQALAQKVAQLGSELLGALEKRDAEDLNRLQTHHEGVVLTLTRDLRRSQLEEARANLQSLRASYENALTRKETYTRWVSEGMSELERAQLGLMIAAAVCNGVSAGINLAAAIAAVVPKIHIGLFTFGTDTPDWHEALGKGAEGIQNLGEGLQVGGEICGILAQQERTTADWVLQRELATIDLKQIEAQIKGAEYQIKSAEQEIRIAERQVEHNEAIARFYRNKFTNQELYDWMAGRLSAMHYQGFQLALSTARAAERAFQFERGSSAPAQSFIQGQHWDSQRKGLVAGPGLGLDLDRMEAAFVASDARRFEITKNISLLELDPMAFLKLKAQGACEFDLTEALFDYDFPGHYCRQVKTIAVELTLGDGMQLNATLTQLTNRVVLEADATAVAFLLEPKETAPASIRSNWKPMQQIALSHHTEQDPNNGLFELRFDNDRFLPFEGTGAVSRWRLELGGRPGSYDLSQLANATIALKYTALQGGAAFAAAVRALLKPTQALRAFDIGTHYGDTLQTFLEDDSEVLELPLYKEMFPNMVSGRISAIFSRYETDAPGAASFILDVGQPVPLPDGKTVDTSGLTVRATGSTLRLRVKGDKTMLRNAYLVMGYRAGAA